MCRLNCCHLTMLPKPQNRLSRIPHASAIVLNPLYNTVLWPLCMIPLFVSLPSQTVFLVLPLTVSVRVPKHLQLHWDSKLVRGCKQHNYIFKNKKENPIKGQEGKKNLAGAASSLNKSPATTLHCQTEVVSVPSDIQFPLTVRQMVH